jgi:hypothetical protein
MEMRRSVGSQLQRWWPVPAVLLGSLLVQKLLFESRYDVSGHAGEHLTSATAVFPAFALVAIVLYVTPSARRQPLVLATCAIWLATTVLVLVGNLRVVDALVGAGEADTPTSELVAGPALDSAHDLANLAPWLAVVAAIALTAAMWRGGHISGRVAAGAVFLCVIVPPWIVPGAGVIVVTVACCISFQRRERELERGRQWAGGAPPVCV